MLFKKLNSWVEDDGYTPSPGDVIFYNWDDNGKGDCTGGADHVGIVVSVSGGKVKVIEGNKNEKVDYRTLSVNGKYIRGYGVPKYASKATETEPETVNPSPAATAFKVGDVVNFTGTKHYTNANGTTAKICKGGRAKITQIYPAGKHPYHLVRVLGTGSTVYGWVDAKYITAAPSKIAVGAKVKVRSGAKTYTGKSLASFVYKNTYTVLELKGDRAVIGLGGKVTAAMNVKDLTLV